MSKGYLVSKIKKRQTVDGEREIIELDDSACLVPVTKDGHYIFSKQYRASRGSVSVSVYGGYVDEGEVPRDSAIREMYEEANISESCIEKIEIVYKNLYPSAGICTEKNSLYIIYLNKNLADLDIKSNDKNESITPKCVLGEHVHTLDFDGMKSWIAQRHIVDKIKREKTLIYKIKKLLRWLN